MRSKKIPEYAVWKAMKDRCSNPNSVGPSCMLFVPDDLAVIVDGLAGKTVAIVCGPEYQPAHSAGEELFPIAYKCAHCSFGLSVL